MLPYPLFVNVVYLILIYRNFYLLLLFFNFVNFTSNCCFLTTNIWLVLIIVNEIYCVYNNFV